MTELPTQSETEAASGPQGGAVAFLFSDIEGSTRHLRALGDDYAELLEEHRRLLRDAFESHAGVVVDSQGDSFFAVFPRVKDAAAAAEEAQRSLVEHPWPGGAVVRVRMGLHAGEPLVREGRYVGLGVHRASRICAAARGGQVLLSQAAASLLADSGPVDVTLRPLGEHELKDFDRPEPLFQLVLEGLPDFPAPARTAPAKGVEFRVLGPLEVIRDGTPVAVGGQRQRALLALLLIRANEIVSIERLVDELWGEHPPKTATTSLQNAVVQLRKALGPDVLVTRHPGYVLRIAPEQIDLAVFESLVRRGRSAEPEERAGLLHEALALWSGPPLADLESEEFAQGEIRRLEELRVAALEDRFDADLELGRHDELVGEIESLVARHPLRERLRGQLLLALSRSGRKAEALSAYHEARRTFIEELGVEPSPVLQDIHRAILRDDRKSPQPPASPKDHYGDVVKALLSSRLVPVIGPRAILCGRPLDASWEKALAAFPPGDEEVASYLAGEFGAEAARGLPHVSQVVSVLRGIGPLYDELHDIYGRDYPSGPVDRLLAGLPPLFRARGLPCQLVVTTGFDASLEQAFAEAGEGVDVVSYIAAGRDRGKFLHVPAGGEARVVHEANLETGITTDDRTVLLKLHGGADRDPRRERESFVVREDDYIDYLAGTDAGAAIPVSLAAKLRRSHFLFLGYALEEWSLRVFLRRLWGEERVAYRSWAVQPDTDPLAVEYWRQRGVDVFDVPLEEYVAELAQQVSDEVAGEVTA